MAINCVGLDVRVENEVEVGLGFALALVWLKLVLGTRRTSESCRALTGL